MTLPRARALFLLTTLGLLSGLLPNRHVFSADPPGTHRVVAGITSANEVLASLEYAVVKLAGKPKAWNNTIKDNLEIFLIGVSREQAVRFDPLLSADFDPNVKPEEEPGMQTQFSIPLETVKDNPVENLKVLLDDNLDPIGITNKRDRSDGDLYQLGGNVYEGWLRSLSAKDMAPYAIIYAQKDAIPKGLSHPQELHKDLAKDGNLAFVWLKNDADGLKSRRDAFANYHKQAMKAFGEKLSTETQDEYALRKRMREQTLSFIEQWFAESSEIKLTAKVDREKNQFPAALTFNALPGTTLHKDIEALDTHKSLFGGIAAPADALLSGRIFMAIDPDREPGMREIYELMRPVAKKKIEDDKKASASEKAARQVAATALLDTLRDSSKTPMLDGFIDVYPSGGKHIIVLGVEAAAPEKINSIVDQLENIVDDWKLEKNVDKSGDVAIHKLSFGEKLPAPLVEFYGPSKCVYLAVAPNAFWICGGEGSLAALKERMEIAARPDRPASDGTLFKLSLHARPVLKNIHETIEQSNWELIKSMNVMSRAAAKEEPKGKAEPGARGGVRPGGGGQAARLAGFDWEQAAIAAMEGLDDRMELTLKRTKSGSLEGAGNSQQGILKALGAVIAKFAEEKLQ